MRKFEINYAKIGGEQGERERERERATFQNAIWLCVCVCIRGWVA